MKRTMTCRSSASIAAAALITVVTAGRAASQQPPPANPAPAPAAAAAPIAPPPPTHVVQTGETLWSLAQQFLGDALLWPEIYRLNTTVVEDPHWIFPGEELRLVATDEPAAPAGAAPQQNVTVAPTGDTARPSLSPARAALVPTIFSPVVNTAPRPTADAIEIQNQRAYRAVREGEYYSAGFLSEGRELPAGRVLANVQTASVRRLTSSTTSMQYADVVIQPPPGEPVQRGDLLLAYRVGGEVRGFGDVIVPTGLLRVASAGEAGGNVIATVVRLYGQITDGQSLIKVAPFIFPRNARAEDVTDGVAGEVVGLRNAREVLGLQDVLFLNRGAEEGVRLGDVFAITATVRTDNGSVEQDKGRALVVNTREHTATVVLVEIYRPDIGAGAAARQIRRMPS